MKPTCPKVARAAILVLLVLCLLPGSLAQAKAATLRIDSNTVGMTKRERTAYKKLRSCMRTRAFREGREWTNDNGYVTTYVRGGQAYGEGGCGCHGFALKLCDKVFGKGKAITCHHRFTKLHVGDLVRVDDDRPTMHTFVVVKLARKSAVVAEGNYGGRVHWGRVVKLSWIKRHGSFVYSHY